MTKRSKSKSSALPKVDPYLEGFMAKLLEKFAGLEKKMDTLIAQTAGKSAGSGDPSKPVQGPGVSQPPRRDRVLYEAICADCHKVCEVPFKPSEERPVYCKTCFAHRRAGGGPNKNFPVLTPVAMSSATQSKPSAAQPAVPADTAIKAKKSQSVKKKKK